MKTLSMRITRLIFFSTVPLSPDKIGISFRFAALNILLIFAACGKPKTAENATAPTLPKADDTEIIAVRTVAVRMENVVHDIVGTGVLASKAEARLSFKTGGLIAKIYVKEGDDVRAGQLLATLDLTEINSQVAQAQLGVQKSERDLQRAKNLYADTVATLEAVQNATTGADLARKTYEIAQFNQRFSEIRAVRGGKIVKKMMSEGELAGPGMPVFFINEATASASDWVVRVGVSDRDWAALRLGGTAKVAFDAYPNDNFEGKISKLADMADPMSGTYEVEITVAPHGKRFATGLFAHVKLPPTGATAMAIIPIEALVEGNGTEGFVFSVKNDGATVAKVPVKIGLIRGRDIGIAAGLERTAAVVTEGSSYLTEKSKVKVIN